MGHIVREMRNEYKIWLENLGIDGRIIWDWIHMAQGRDH